MPGPLIRVISGSAARTVACAADATPRRTNTSPFGSGERARIQSPGAADFRTAWHPGKGSAGHTLIELPDANVAAAAGTVGIAAATRDSNLHATGDITIDIGSSLSKTAIPAAATIADASDVLEAIVLVNGVPYTRLQDGSNPADGQWSRTDGDTIVIGVSTTLRVGAVIEIIVPTAVVQPTGGALVAGREYEVELRDFYGTFTAAVDVTGNPNG